ncbi:PstS family phosphate ABC transporter substrate-binding protein [Natronomonas marina]|jgi:phosphate transport system substrate-binding protein|uniref:PstS family phosphate ABC transporter substrate-binding protein n=1 Tax=Natronomonas marina TaxID=2961939 RepID=UPI0020C99084|nr:PstS family phosphate ABC transporter substrate-binding protein [Natronomonas marina]
MADGHAEGLTRRNALKALGGAGAIAVAGCTTEGGNGNGDSLSGEITITGSSTVFPLMAAIAKEFDQEHETNTTVTPTGSGGGFSNNFCPGNADFNNASRQIKQAEKDLCEENGVEWTELTVATDALTVVVNPEADFVDSLTVEELAQIWKADAVETWSEVREEFPDEEIERFGAADTSGTYDYFIENVQGSDAGHTDDYRATEKDNVIAEGVANDKYAIGYFGFSYFYNNPDQLKALAIDNGDGPVEPSLDTAASGEYQPLSRSLYTYPAMASLSEEHVAEFARYVLERAASQSLVADQVGYVPLTDEQQQSQQDTLESAIEEAQG